MEPPDVGRDLAGDSVPDEIEDSEERQGGDALGDYAGDSFPVGDGDAGEEGKFTDGGGDVAGHVAGPVGFLENRVLGLAPEVDVGDAVEIPVAADAVPAATAVGAGPGVEDAQIGLVERRFEGQKCRPVRRMTGLHGPT